jgi:hypothetical protein
LDRKGGSVVFSWPYQCGPFFAELRVEQADQQAEEIASITKGSNHTHMVGLQKVAQLLSAREKENCETDEQRN